MAMGTTASARKLWNSDLGNVLFWRNRNVVKQGIVGPNNRIKRALAMRVGFVLHLVNGKACIPSPYISELQEVSLVR